MNPTHSLPGVALLLWTCTFPTLAAQQPSPQPSVADSVPSGADASPFRRLELPTPNRMRTGAGAPGPEYWQQRVDYVIRASLDTIAQRVTGQERIT